VVRGDERPDRKERGPGDGVLQGGAQGAGSCKVPTLGRDARMFEAAGQRQAHKRPGARHKHPH